VELGQNSDVPEVIWSQRSRRVSKGEVRKIVLINGAVVSLHVGLLKYLGGNMALRHVGRVAPGERSERKQLRNEGKAGLSG